MITNEMLLIFFALPIAVIIISIALQRIFRCPILVSAIIFAIFLIVTFIIDNLTFLIAAIAYAILSYITAFLTCVICRFLNSCSSCNCNYCNRESQSDSNVISVSQQLNNSQNDDNNEINTIFNNTQNSNCGCNNNQVSGVNGVSARINVIPNNNGNTGNITGCYRRREF